MKDDKFKIGDFDTSFLESFEFKPEQNIKKD